ncbi:MAG: Lrp/AsnC family transcriptional regulator [Clostridia bacterium]|nr:Lrp/AsnC family transcriptional regulator [Clostridia bacterium]
MKEKLLHLLSENARYTSADLATMLGVSETEICAAVAELEADGIIRGYKALIDWASVDDRHITAIIEINVTPQADAGFEEIAERIAEFEYVEAVYLMSGGYDLSVIVTGQTFQKVAMFVAKHLATMKEVTSTGTHFVLRRYKDMGVKMCGTPDDRETVSL